MKKLIFFIFGISVLGLSLAGLFIIFIARGLPDPAKITERQVAESTKIFDRTGKIILYEIHGEEKRTVIPLEEMPEIVKQATIAIEDADFYKHSGISLRGIARAIFIDILKKGFVQGGSGITQQLVKNSFLGRERTITRKIKEAILAIQLERKYAKDDILEFYLNQIPYGSNAYGIQAASRTFFGKDAKDLTLAEAAALSSLPKAPTYYSPHGSRKNELMARKDYVLDRMAALGQINNEEAGLAKKEVLNFLAPRQNIRAPHFVMLVREYLNEKYGEDVVESGGLNVITTLDWELQEMAENIVKEGAARNEKLIKAHNAALAALNPKTGEILAMVGSRDYFDIENEGNFNVATALRQPGSAFKPFVYATAFKKGFTPDTVLFDVPTEFHSNCGPGATSTVAYDRKLKPDEEPAEYEKCYHPANYDEKFRGPVTLRQAIAQSINVPSVKLLYLAGVNDAIELARGLGITSLIDPKRYSLSLVLGGAEVQLIEMISAYGVFANDGILAPKTFILEVKRGEEILEEKKDEPRAALDTNIARIINDVLSDNEARIGVFQRYSSLYFSDRQVAAKTGTTQEYRDAWTIGYTPSIVAGVWVGNNDNTPIQQKGSGVLAAAPIWHAFMASATAKMLPEEFPRPEYQRPEKPILRGLWQGGEIIKLDKISKKLASTSTPPEYIEDVAVGEPHDILYWIDKENPTEDKPENPEKDSQYTNWEWAFQEWLKTSGFKQMSREELPKEYDDVHTEANRPVITKISLEEATSTVPEATGTLISALKLIISVKSKFSLKEIDVFSNDELVQSISLPQIDKPYEIIIPKIEGTEELPQIKIKAYDNVGNWNELSLAPQ